MPDSLVSDLVTTYLLDPGDRVVEVRAGREGWLVTADSGDWIVRQSRRVGEAGHDLYDIAPAIMTDPPGPSDGVAVLPDGGQFHLNDAAAMRGFLAARGYPGDAELAWLMGLYQAGDRAPESVVNRPAEVLLPMAVEDALALPDIEPPTRIDEPAGTSGWTLRFYTQHLGAGPDRQPVTRLYRWEVRADPDGDVSWHARPA